VKLFLQSIRLEEGTITYIPNLGRDMVLDMRYKGRKYQTRESLKSSKIDLVLGDGKASYEEDKRDSACNNEKM
jgi:hypothetical protein